jgi:hypothetical protein
MITPPNQGQKKHTNLAYIPDRHNTKIKSREREQVTKTIN